MYKSALKGEYQCPDYKTVRVQISCLVYIQSALVAFAADSNRRLTMERFAKNLACTVHELPEKVKVVCNGFLEAERQEPLPYMDSSCFLGGWEGGGGTLVSSATPVGRRFCVPGWAPPLRSSWSARVLPTINENFHMAGEA